jgi:hypothetical protein
MGALNRWVYRVSDGQILMGSGFDPSVYLTDQTAYALLDLPDDAPWPNPRSQRAASSTTLRAATSSEQAAYDAVVLDAEVRVEMDARRLMSALVWAIIDTYSAPATVAKYQAARTKIVNAYKSQPWKA